MNEKIIKQALAKLKYTYPGSFKDYTQGDVQFMIKMWSNDFKDDDPQAFETAIERLRIKSKWCPSIAEIKQEIALISNPVLQMNADKEWDNVLKVVRKYGSYRQDEAMKSLNPYTSNIVRQVGYMRICMSENIQWERKEFIDLFNINKERDESTLMLSEPQMTLAELTRMAELKSNELLEHNEKLLLENK